MAVKMTLSKQQAHDILQQAELIVPEQQVQAAVVRVAQEINSALADVHPLLLSVMGGAVVFTGQLLPLLNFPLDFDYVHVSRYGSKQQGGALHWKVEPGENVSGRVVLVVDDILDEGETLAAVKQRVLDLGAAGFYRNIPPLKKGGRGDLKRWQVPLPLNPPQSPFCKGGGCQCIHAIHLD